MREKEEERAREGRLLYSPAAGEGRRAGRSFPYRPGEGASDVSRRQDGRASVASRPMRRVTTSSGPSRVVRPSSLAASPAPGGTPAGMRKDDDAVPFMHPDERVMGPLEGAADAETAGRDGCEQAQSVRDGGRGRCAGTGRRAGRSWRDS